MRFLWWYIVEEYEGFFFVGDRFRGGEFVGLGFWVWFLCTFCFSD